MRQAVQSKDEEAGLNFDFSDLVVDVGLLADAFEAVLEVWFLTVSVLVGLKPAEEPPESGRLLAARSAGSSVACIFFAPGIEALRASCRSRAFSSAAIRARTSGGRGGTRSWVMGLSCFGVVSVKYCLKDSDDTGVSSALLLRVRFTGTEDAVVVGSVL